ncbi:MAG TPA: hypothetical protein VK711_09675 [Puia sp.]|jgi:hypothetical protein|nr:hypothetical protein [Puia sp.]
MDRNIQFITFTITIEKRLFGFIITILGVTGLILAIYNLVRVNAAPNHSVISVAIYGIQGILFFFAGIGLIRNTQDLTSLRSEQDLTNRSSINEHGKLINLEETQQELKEKINEFYPEIMDADLIFMGGRDDELLGMSALKLYKIEKEMKNRLESITAG